ncbi:GGDEF domain-containing protein [Nostoc sp. 'Peltigera membranacea cyanobiont' 210A]|uniref:diguanylate cyclase n=1 Tax=Nostoc sp. 'Peltigera membranacea cyanobiont' 210A TaxID=2014529 RepID=UPI000B95B2FC|nr:diguanylate cyclase [Nostoc sp. 'Peltigera membranacea cyanobiont' 210A]OYD94459.1 GGDEF domain-containing protein [Nostoc sp. 'Peltigera membranacea cyanobiont' 210A]
MEPIYWNCTIAHSITAFSYFGIPIVIGVFFTKTKATIPSKFWLAFFLSGGFVLFCGFHHFLAIFEPYMAVSLLHLAVLDVMAFISLSALLYLTPTSYQIVKAIAKSQEDTRELQRSQQMQQLFLDHGPFAAYIKDEQSRVLYYNQELQSRFSVDPQEWLGKTDSEFLPDPEEARRVMENDRVVLKTLRPLKLIEQVKIPGNNQPCYWLSFKFPFSDYATGAYRIGGISIDITESIEAQRSLTDLNRQLEEKTLELEAKKRELIYLSDMTDMLYSCESEDEVYQVVALTCSKLFPNMSGCVCIIANSKNYVQINSIWGDERSSKEIFSLSECWALRRGKLNLLSPRNTGLICSHLIEPVSGAHLCVPLFGQGELVGILHIYAPEQISPEVQQTSEIIARTLGIALNNLSIKQRLTHDSLRDGMTQLFNQSYMQSITEQRLAEAERSGQPLSIIFLDIDNFKSYNSRYGHVTANIVLQALAKLLLKSIRSFDIACRWGGEEFVIVMPNMTLETLRKRVEQLRLDIEQMQLKDGDQILQSITASFGIAVSEPGITVKDFLNRANQAMLEAKRTGKNRVREYINTYN